MGLSSIGALTLGKDSCIYGKIKEDEERKKKKKISIFRALITPLKIGDDLKFVIETRMNENN